ncbi:AP-1 complex subunit gamma [Thecamonas trahens ATCC 50062]|uniref:AP-1 complex subunit gamma n=1 Tax=Thecamonas trahens ATCC 50062 TaxID=461836 RepID=A0A0L0DU76_THETB|nr:AP-1 complex subunit gamma [Thecamonas trahens ATCC 50062]KNC55747.1 AP-1 complex subunit gamma [Thecamonas trahens ATCC 50062]|eukprot:XP_013752900.1 AP-1 complex subunit gamma [Thecamonas trahens ATCC 50062]
MSLRLREFIDEVRSARTSSEERELVRRELAAIRTKFAQENTDFRLRNVAKLLYMQMRGYSTQFAQLECLKLVASESFAQKRVGYLGLMLLLDEDSEVLMLVTNSLKNDLNHPNMYVVGLALCSLGNMCTADMGRDLAGEVEKLLSSSNHYVRKKAALCAQRIIRKCPDLLENFVGLAKSQLVKRHHGVLLTGITLMITMCEVDPAVVGPFRRFVPALVGALKSLIVSGYAPEHDVGGVTDPFIQVKLLRLLRVLGRGDVESSEKMNDVLAYVATNTETKHNVGNAILYEVVQTIMSIEADSGLRLLAVNILGRFLLNKDNNIRYVALNTLSKALHGDLQAVQRHRATITQCLKDPDVSIRKRALELCYKLVTDRNANDLIAELCLFVDVIDDEFRPSLVANLIRLAGEFSQGDRWHANLALRILRSAGSYVTPVVGDRIISLFARLESEQQYIVKRLYDMLMDAMSSEELKRVGAWCIGEFAEQLVAPGGGAAVSHVSVSDEEIVTVLELIDGQTTTTTLTRTYVLTALIKLSVRLTDDGAHARILALLSSYQNSMQVELQQRACEYLAIYQMTDLRPALLEHIPVLEVDSDGDGDDDDDDNDDDEIDGNDVYNKNNVKITYAFAKQPGRPEVTAINATFTNGNAFELRDLSYRIAVPTYIQLKLGPASSTVVPAANGGAVTQVIHLLNSKHGAAPVLLKYQLAFNANGTPYTEQGDVAGLPAGL